MRRTFTLLNIAQAHEVSDNNGSSSDEYNSEGEGSEIAIDPNNESKTEELEDQQVTHPQDPETVFVPGETFRPDSPELMPQPQITVFSVQWRTLPCLLRLR